MDTSEGGGQWGTGGMATKLTAARLATAAGCAMAICSAAAPERVAAIVHGERVGTVFRPLPHALRCAVCRSCLHAVGRYAVLLPSWKASAP